MFSDHEPLFSPRTFWFANEELLTSVLRVEIDAVTQLLSKYPDLPKFFDDPKAPVPQRAACFALLAHRKLMDMVYETFAGLYIQSPSQGDAESNALSRTNNLVAADAPAWVLEMNEVVGLLPFRIYDALPEPLRTQGYDADNSEQVATIKSAAAKLSKVEQIQALTQRVLNQQLQRLEQRWSATLLQVSGPKKRKARRTRDKQRMIRDKLIAEIDDVSKTPREFLRLMDERKVQPQPTWKNWPGSWVQAYMDTHLRALIHKDKSRALARVLTGRKA